MPWAISGAAIAALLGTVFFGSFAALFKLGPANIATAPVDKPVVVATAGGPVVPDAPSGAQASSFTLKPMMAKTQPLRTIAFAPNKSTFAFAGDDGIVRLWDAVTFEPVRRFPTQPPAKIRTVVFSGDGKYLFSTGSDHLVHIWDVATGVEARPALTDWPGMSDTEFFSLAVTSDDSSSSSPVRWVKAGGADGGIRTWDLNQKGTTQPRERPVIQYPGTVDSLTFTPLDSGRNDKWASAGHGGAIIVYSFRDQSQTKLNADSRAIFQIKFSKTGDTLASAGWDGVKLWRVGDGAISPAPLRNFDNMHAGYVLKVDWSEDQKWLASGGQDGNVVLWDAQTGSPVTVFGGKDRHTGDVEAVAFHPNKKWLLSLSEDKTLKAWDLETKKLLFTLVAYSDGPYLAYTPSGRYTSSGDFHEHLAKEQNGVPQD